MHRRRVAKWSYFKYCPRMGEVLKFHKPTAREKNRGRTLCAHNFHRWEIVTDRKFDVKQGRLVTLMRCTRCGTEKTRAL